MKGNKIMGLFSNDKRLKRKDLGKKFYAYHSQNNINDENGTEIAIDYLNKIEDFLNNYEYVSDNDYILGGRKKFIYEEIDDILEGKKDVHDKIGFVVGSLEEFMCNTNLFNSNELTGKELQEAITKNDNYYIKGYICLEEKEHIDHIINKIRQKLQKK